MRNKFISARVNTAFYQSTIKTTRRYEKVFVGIDFSKRKMDVSIVEKDFPERTIAYKQFINNAEGAKKCANGSNIRQIQARNLKEKCCSVVNTQALIV